jgi:hypothetical protein
MWDSFPSALTDDSRMTAHMPTQDFDWNMLNSNHAETHQSGWPLWAPGGPHEGGGG